ncbi:hypothetical protein [Phreatobacter sp.]|uniref:hypothetical protein n=1 Tax=Phreatobacter sp. TaxID=1966341 RepID=UPI003F6EE3AC
MVKPLVMPFRADVEPATRAIATLARAVATGMGSVSASALASHQATGSALGGITTKAGSTARAIAGLAVAYQGTIAAVSAFAAATAAGVAQLDRFREIAEKAAASGVGTTFFQSFVVGAERLGAKLRDVERDFAALERSTRTRFSAESLTGSSNKAVEAFERAFLDVPVSMTSTALQGLRDATDPQEAIRQVLQGLTDLEAQGRRLEAIDIARNLGLTDMAERVEAGRAKFADLYWQVRELEQSGLRDGSLVSPELIKRAEELKLKFEENARVLGQNMRPILDECVRLALAMGENAAWTAEQFNRVVGVLGGIVGFLREAANLVGMLGRSDLGVRVTAEARIAGLREEIQEAQRQLDALPRPRVTEEVRPDGGGFGLAPDPLGAQRETLRARVVQMRGEIEAISQMAAEERRGRALAGLPPPPGVPIDPTRRSQTGAATGGTAGGSSADETDKRTEAVEKFMRAQERAIALSQVELATVGRSAVERARLTEVVKAEAQAREQGGRLTEAERDKVAALAAQQQILKNAIEDATAAQRALSDALKYGGDRLIDLVFRGGKASDMLRGLAAELARAALTGQGMFAQLMGLAPAAGSPAGALGGLLGLLGGLSGGGGAGGALSLFSLFHAGGVIGAGGAPVLAPTALLAGAPRAHSGRRLGADEVPIIAQLGEEVLTRNQRRATARALDMADRAAEAASGRGGGSSVTIGDIRVDAPGASRADAEEIARRVDQRIREVTVPFLQSENARGVEIDPYTRVS